MWARAIFLLPPVSSQLEYFMDAKGLTHTVSDTPGHISYKTPHKIPITGQPSSPEAMDTINDAQTHNALLGYDMDLTGEQALSLGTSSSLQGLNASRIILITRQLVQRLPYQKFFA